MNKKSVAIAFISILALFSVISFGGLREKRDSNGEEVIIVRKAHWENI